MAKKNKIWLWIFAGAVCITALACFALPMYIIRPFRAQTAQELSIALYVRQVGPILAIVCGFASLYAAWRLRRWPATLLCVLTLAGVAANQINIFEIMFRPDLEPGFARASEAKLDGDDMVLAVKLGNASHAYPIRMLAYHHIVNDRVGGVAIVGTY